MAYNPDDDDDLEEENPYASLQEMADDLNGQVSESIKVARAEAKDYAERFKFQNDGDYYFSVVFRSKEECEKFIADAGVPLDGKRFIMYDNFRRFLK
jgi:hypothetical protein